MVTSVNPLTQSLVSQPREVCLLTTITSTEFTVHSSRSWPGMGESTSLTRSFSEQGVKLRLRKEPRTLLRKRGPASDDYEPKSYHRTKVGRSGDTDTQTLRRDSMQRTDSPGSVSRRTDSPIQQRTASGMGIASSEVFQNTQIAYGQPSRQSSETTNFSQRFETSDPSSLTPLHEHGSSIIVPIHTREGNSVPSLLSSHQESSDMSSLSSAAVTSAEEFGGNIPRRSLSIAQLRQANSDSALRSHTTAGIPFTGIPENPFLPNTSLPNSNRTSFSDFSGAYTHQPPSIHPPPHRNPQSYSFTQHSHSHSQSSLTSHSPEPSRSTPHSYYSFNAGPRDSHTGMGSSALSSPFESPETVRRDYGSWAGEGGEERTSLPSRGQDPTSAGTFSAPTPFYNQRHSTGSYGHYNNASRSPLPISQAQGLGITSVYSSASNYMPAPPLISQHNHELLSARPNDMASVSGATVEPRQLASSSEAGQTEDNVESSISDTGGEMRGRGGW